jgi:hypothetical protein
MVDALFDVLRDGRFEPTPLARGPWSPDALHGGPVAALLARAMERAESAVPMHPARLTVELLRPVPMAPLSLAIEVVRDGRKIQIVDAFLSAGSTEVARARMLRIRIGDVPLPEGAADAAPPPFALPADCRPMRPAWADDQVVAYHSHATEHRVARGDWGEPGPITSWIRLRCPVVAGESPSPLSRVAGAADFGNGISWVLPFAEYLFINPDLTIHLHRLPVGEWIGLDAVTRPGEGGVGVAESGLFDERGRIGRSLQSLLLERR